MNVTTQIIVSSKFYSYLTKELEEVSWCHIRIWLHTAARTFLTIPSQLDTSGERRSPCVALLRQDQGCQFSGFFAGPSGF